MLLPRFSSKERVPKHLAGTGEGRLDRLLRARVLPGHLPNGKPVEVLLFEQLDVLGRKRAHHLGQEERTLASTDVVGVGQLRQDLRVTWQSRPPRSRR